MTSRYGIPGYCTSINIITVLLQSSKQSDTKRRKKSWSLEGKKKKDQPKSRQQIKVLTPARTTVSPSLPYPPDLPYPSSGNASRQGEDQGGGSGRTVSAYRTPPLPTVPFLSRPNSDAKDDSLRIVEVVVSGFREPGNGFQKPEPSFSSTNSWRRKSTQ